MNPAKRENILIKVHIKKGKLKWVAVIGKKFYIVAHHRVHQGEGYKQALFCHPM